MNLLSNSFNFEANTSNNCATRFASISQNEVCVYEFLLLFVSSTLICWIRMCGQQSRCESNVNRLLSMRTRVEKTRAHQTLQTGAHPNFLPSASIYLNVICVDQSMFASAFNYSLIFDALNIRLLSKIVFFSLVSDCCCL